jgi:hypothetical protein
MADDALDETLRDAQEQFLTQVQEQIDTWHTDRELLMRNAEVRFTNAGVNVNDVWDTRNQMMREIWTPKDVDGWKEDFLNAIAMTKEDREWRALEQSPAYQAWKRERNQPFHEPDTEEIGWHHEQRRLEFEQWGETQGREGHPHYEFLNGQTPAEVLLEAGQARAWREEGYTQQEVEQETAGQAAWEHLEASALLQAFAGKTPDEQQDLYVRQITQDAIATGQEEGYPIRDHKALEQQVRRGATADTIEAYKASLRPSTHTPAHIFIMAAPQSGKTATMGQPTTLQDRVSTMAAAIRQSTGQDLIAPTPKKEQSFGR